MQLSKNRFSVRVSLRHIICGADRVRTDDIQLAKLALSQLSYSPETKVDRLFANERGQLALDDALAQCPAKWA